MQFTKDSFSMVLRERLKGLNQARTVTLNRAQRPAIIVPENELETPADRLPECLYLEWGALKTIDAGNASSPLCGLDCAISYFTYGSVESGVDRGRVLGALDRELLMICQPAHTRKVDFTQSPSADLGTSLFWTLPEISETKVVQNDATSRLARREHKANLTVFFFPEVATL